MTTGLDNEAPNVGRVVLAETQPVKTRRRFWSRLTRELRHAPVSALFGLVVILLYVLVAILAPVLAPYGESQVVGDQYEVWSDKFFFGTDQLGRDLLSRLIYGARNTIGIALLTTALAFAIGGLLGLLSATLRGWIDQLLGRFVDVLMAIPELIFALIFVVAVGLGPFAGVLALVIGSIGALSKVYAESIEAIDPQQVAAVRVTYFAPQVVQQPHAHVHRFGVTHRVRPVERGLLVAGCDGC